MARLAAQWVGDSGGILPADLPPPADIEQALPAGIQPALAGPAEDVVATR